MPLLAEKGCCEEVLEGIEGRALYKDKIVSDLQNYERPLKQRLVENNLLKLINETLSRSDIPTNTEVSIMIDEGPKVTVVPSMMQHVSSNLVLNALQAISDGGLLTIESPR